MRPRALTKFRLLLAMDMVNCAWPVAIFFYPERLRFFIAMIVGLPIGLFLRYARARVVRITDPLTLRQMRVHAAVALAVYLVWIAGIIWGAIALASPAVWALASIFLPVLGVFCYWAVRVNLGLEQTTGGWQKHP